MLIHMVNKFLMVDISYSHNGHIIAKEVSLVEIF